MEITLVIIDIIIDQKGTNKKLRLYCILILSFLFRIEYNQDIFKNDILEALSFNTKNYIFPRGLDLSEIIIFIMLTIYFSILISLIGISSQKILMSQEYRQEIFLIILLCFAITPSLYRDNFLYFCNLIIILQMLKI